MEKLLKKKVCFVTGAGSGIGKEIAWKFAQNGGTVYANTLHEKSIDQWWCNCPEKDHIKKLCFDITDSNSLRNAVQQIRKEEGRIDVLVNNAGMVSYEPLSMVSKSHLQDMFGVNVFAVFETIQIASRIMGKKGGGSIINLASIVGEKGASGQAAYSASKGAVIAMTKSIAKELAGKDIRVNAMAPGMVGTERFVREMEGRFPDMKDKIGMGRIARPEEVANVALFLASDMSSYITGQIVGVEGCSYF